MFQMYILADIFIKTNWDKIIDIIVGVIIVAILTGIKVIKFLITWIMKRKLKKNWYKELEFPINKKTKKSFKCYISTRGQDMDPCNSEEMIDNRHCFSQELIPFFMQNNFEKNKNRYYIVLADSGMGKTTFLFNLFFSYYKKLIRKHEIKFIPLFIDSVFEEIEKIENKQNTILLLDGLDENREAMNDHKKYMEKIVNKTIKFHTIIMTCRTQFFPDSDSEPKDIDKIKFGVGKKSVEFEKYYISPFNEKEINMYLKKRYNPIIKRSKYKRSKKLIANCPKLMPRPMLLSFMGDLLADKTKKYDYGYEIYQELISKWIERESVNNLYEFFEKVAEFMYLNKTLYITEFQIKDLCKECNIQLKEDEVLTRSLFNRNVNGIYKFAHKSILELFLANKAYHEIEFRKNITLDNFNGYDMVKSFLNEMDVCDFNKLFSQKYSKVSFQFFKYLQLYDLHLSDHEILNSNFVGCNLCNAILKDINVNMSKFIMSDLSKVNFCSAQLIGAELEDVNLTSANLQFADLYNATFSFVNLSQADLTDANLVGANLIDTNLSQAILEFADLTGATLNRVDLTNANLMEAILTETVLIETNLEASRWYKDNVLKVLPQLKYAKFTYIIIEDQEPKKVYRSELFPDER